MAAAWVRLCALVLIGVTSGAALAKDKTPTAIVVGGGLAGLTAAYELQDKGWQVTLLEAKSGMGGRSAWPPTSGSAMPRRSRCSTITWTVSSLNTGGTGVRAYPWLPHRR